jgi:predicted amidohydrolase YtcJ
LGGEADYCGYPWLKDEQAEEFCRKALDDNRQILTHCNGDAASQQFLDAYEKAFAQSTNPNKQNLRPVMIHCQTVRNDQLDRMAELKMIASIFVGHVYYWGDIHMKNFGPERGHHISPAKDALDRGLVVNFHQDTPVTKPNMMHTVWAAVNRKSRLGNLIGEEQKIGVYDALKAVTINAAYQYFEEDSKGSIRAGKRADLVVLDRNPLETDPAELKDIRVLETIKDGKTIYKA